MQAAVHLQGGVRDEGGLDWSFEFLWTRLIDGRGLIGLFGSVGGSRRRPLSKAHAAAARSGGPVPRSGPDLPRVVGTRRNASKSRNRRASASLSKPGVSVAVLRQPPGRTKARVSGSALAVSRTSRARPIWTRCSQRSRTARLRCHIAPMPSVSLRAVHRLGALALPWP